MLILLRRRLRLSIMYIVPLRRVIEGAVKNTPDANAEHRTWDARGRFPLDP